MRDKTLFLIATVLISTLLLSFTINQKNKQQNEIKLVSDACLYGTVKYRNGSKVNGTMTITQSWNGKKAFPKKGKYRLCLGSNPKKTIKVFVDGKVYNVYVDGDTEFNITRD